MNKNLIKVNVTAAIIADAKKRIEKGCLRSRSCPVSLALRRKLKKKVCSNEDNIIIGDVYFGGKYYVTPHAVQVFIKRFDNDRPVKPFSFVLNRANSID